MTQARVFSEKKKKPGTNSGKKGTACTCSLPRPTRCGKSISRCTGVRAALRRHSPPGDQLGGGNKLPGAQARVRRYAGASTKLQSYKQARTKKETDKGVDMVLVVLIGRYNRKGAGARAPAQLLRSLKSMGPRGGGLSSGSPPLLCPGRYGCCYHGPSRQQSKEQ